MINQRIKNISQDKFKLDITDFLVVLSVSILLLIQSLIVYNSPFSLSGDEAFYWLWSKNLDLCYYEKGPGIAVFIKLTTMIFGDTYFGVRSGAIFCQFLISIILYFFVSRNFSKEVSIVALAMYWSTLFFGTLGVFLTCDPPLCLFWLLCNIYSYKAIKNDNPTYWIPTFLCIGISCLFKYSSIILLPFLILYLIINKEYRRHIYSGSFILGILLLFICFTPVLIWNLNHEWINFSKLSGHFEAKKASSIKGQYLLELIGGQIGLIGPIVFSILMYGGYLGYKKYKLGDKTSGIFLCCSIPLAILCVIMSLSKRVYANWPMPLYISLILLFSYLYSRDNSQNFSRKYLKYGLMLNFLVLIFSHVLFTGENFNFPIDNLPTKKLMVGLDQGLEVNKRINDEAFNNCSNNLQSNKIIISDKYTHASLLAFYSNYKELIHVADPSEAKFSQFDLWQDWEKLKGKNALLVFSESDEMPYFIGLFDKIIPITELDTMYGDKIVGKFYFFAACSYNGDKIPNVTMLSGNKLVRRKI